MEQIIKNLIEPHVSELNKNVENWFKVTYTGLFKTKRVVITAMVKIGPMEPYTAVVGDGVDEVAAWENAIDALDMKLNGVTDWHAIDEIGDYLVAMADKVTANLCDTCKHILPTCDATQMLYGKGKGKGKDNITSCDTYEKRDV